MQKLICYFGLLIGFCSSHYVVAQIDTPQLKELKRQKMESSDPFWNLCFIDGLPDISFLNDSINHYKIGFPKNYNLIFSTGEDYLIHRFNSPEKSNRDYPILEIKISESSFKNLENYFDEKLIKRTVEKSLLSFGREIINGYPSFWIESFNRNKAEKFRHKVSYYLFNPLSQKIFTITIKSDKNNRNSRDFCSFGVFVRQLKWIK